MPECKKTSMKQLLSRSSNTTHPTSEDDNMPATLYGNAELREYAVDAFQDKRIDKRCKNVAIDQFCTSGIILKPGESLTKRTKI